MARKKNDNKLKQKDDELRQKALEKLKESAPSFDKFTLDQAIEIAHELNVHKIELEMQNENLKTAYAQIEIMRDQYADLFDRAPVGYISSNIEGTIINANKTIGQMLGKAVAELKDTSIMTWFEDKDDIHRHIRALKKGKSKIQCKNQISDGKVDKRFILLESEIIQNDSLPEQSEIRTIVTDITQQKELEEKLHHAERLESIGTLAGGIAHEFNNLLAIIIGNNEMAISEVPKWSPLRESLDEIHMASIRARDVVKQLLMFSRQDADHQEPINIGQVISDSLKLIRSSIPEHITIHKEIPDNLEPVLGNATQINQMLINLCSNAADAMQETGGDIFIDVSNIILKETDEDYPFKIVQKEYINISIRDTGCGMPDKVIEKIFEPYFTTKAIGRGTGIGLSVVHGIVKGHQGNIHVESQINKGASFIIQFPVCRQKFLENREQKVKMPTGTECILFVDDEDSVYKLVSRQLKRLDYRIEATKDPLKALEMFKKDPERFDLVITDLAMPVMTGDSLAREMLSIRPGIPIILCTGYNEHFTNASVEFSHIIKKPFTLDALAISIRSVLDKNGT